MIICGRDDCVYKREGDACHAPNIRIDANGVCRRYAKRTEVKDCPTYLDYSLKKQEEKHA